MAVAILRVDRGFDYSKVLGENIETPLTFDELHMAKQNNSTTNLLKISQVQGSNESISRNGSHGKTMQMFISIPIRFRAGIWTSRDFLFFNFSQLAV